MPSAAPHSLGQRQNHTISAEHRVFLEPFWIVHCVCTCLCVCVDRCGSLDILKKTSKVLCDKIIN